MIAFALTTRASNSGPLTGDQIDAKWTAIADILTVLQSLVPTLGFAKCSPNATATCGPSSSASSARGSGRPA